MRPSRRADWRILPAEELLVVLSPRGAGKSRRSLGGEGVASLATVRAGGAGADRQRLAAEGALGPGHGDLPDESLGGDLGGTGSGEQLGDDAVDRGVETGVGMHL